MKPTFLLTPYNMEAPAGTPAQKSRQWTESVINVNGKKSVNLPDFCRFRGILCMRSGKSREGYSKYPSIDWNGREEVYDEKAGLEWLLKECYDKGEELLQATIFGNYTTDLRRESHNFNYKVAAISRQQLIYWREPVWKFTEEKRGNKTVIRVQVNLAESIALYA